MPRFLDMEREHRSLIRASRRTARQRAAEETSGSGARYGLFATLSGGISELVDALTKTIEPRVSVRLNTSVREVTPDDDGPGHRIVLDDGSFEQFDAVILALPAYRAADMLATVDQALVETLRTIEYASSAIAVSGHRLADIDHPLDAFGLVIPAIERRKILAVSFSSRKFPGRAPKGHVLLRTFVGGAMQPELTRLNDSELLSLVRDELSDILGVRWQPDFSLVARYERAMPQYHVGHLRRVEAIESRLTQHAGLELAGSAYHGVGIPDSVHSGEQAAESVFGETISDGCPPPRPSAGVTP